MALLKTAKQHFDEDISRASALLEQAEGLEESVLKDDILRAAYMMAVGSVDAYFCDAYADLVSRSIRAKEKDPTAKIGSKIGNLKLSVTTLLEAPEDGWRWRNAARDLVEKQSVLSIEEIKNLFNQFFPEGRKLFTAATIGDWITHPDAKTRMFGITRTDFKKLSNQQRGHAKDEARKKFNSLFDKHFQRRHDCIHNCDRPKQALRPIGSGQTSKAIDDMKFLIERCHEAFLDEFARYLQRCGFESVTRNAVGAPALK